jgi:hypothetical protein
MMIIEGTGVVMKIIDGTEVRPMTITDAIEAVEMTIEIAGVTAAVMRTEMAETVGTIAAAAAAAVVVVAVEEGTDMALGVAIPGVVEEVVEEEEEEVTLGDYAEMQLDLSKD